MSGWLHMISIGPGFADYITPAAERSIKECDVVVAYDLYLTWIKPWLAGKEVITLPLTEEKARAAAAINAARSGKKAVIISSGDIGIYGMATLVFEDLSEDDEFEVKVIPGITAASSCASLLGAPLSHDFMTLSLSDLLCPWDWIEHRARHAAQADLCMALYNVMSKKRTDGVFKIIKLVSQHKGPNTICGIVRNAYRPDQSIKIVTLAELEHQQFDMLTTVIIGNRFTQRKKNWMFTPRGYNQWQSQEITTSYPKGAVWVFSGTSDGNELAQAIANSGAPVVVSSATEYGAKLAQKACPTASITFGRTGRAAREKTIADSRARAIVDATHPYAETMSGQLIEIAEAINLPYIRFERPSCTMPAKTPLSCRNLNDALDQAQQLGAKVFLTTGSKQLDLVKGHRLIQDNRVFVRLTPDADSLAKAAAAGIQPANIIAMQGPFSKELNIAMWQQLGISVVITKESGTAGGYEAKVLAAEELGIPLIVMQRPVVNYPRIAREFSEVLQLVSSESVSV